MCRQKNPVRVTAKGCACFAIVVVGGGLLYASLNGLGLKSVQKAFTVA